MIEESSGTADFSSKITISSSFTAECAENAEASENPNVDWNVLKLCALDDLRGDKSPGFFMTVPATPIILTLPSTTTFSYAPALQSPLLSSRSATDVSNPLLTDLSALLL